MQTQSHNPKLDNADVVAVFDEQAPAEEAVWGLRVAGFSDKRIGYFSRNLAGQVTDYTGASYALVGLVVGLVAGGLIGFLLGKAAVVLRAGPLELEATRVFITWAVSGVLLGGFLGGLLGWGTPRGYTVHKGDEMATGRFVVAVLAGDRQDVARAVLHRAGGHASTPADAVKQHPAGAAAH